MRHNFACLPTLSRQSRAILLLVTGLLAMAMLTFGGARTVRAEAGSFYAEICTSKGVLASTSSAATGDLSHQKDGESHTDCCQLCAATAALLSPGNTIAALPAPTFGQIFITEPQGSPALVAHLAHPPRGPPLL